MFFWKTNSKKFTNLITSITNYFLKSKTFTPSVSSITKIILERNTRFNNTYEKFTRVFDNSKWTHSSIQGPTKSDLLNFIFFFFKFFLSISAFLFLYYSFFFYSKYYYLLVYFFSKGAFFVTSFFIYSSSNYFFFLIKEFFFFNTDLFYNWKKYLIYNNNLSIFTVHNQYLSQNKSQLKLYNKNFHHDFYLKNLKVTQDFVKCTDYTQGLFSTYTSNFNTKNSLLEKNVFILNKNNINYNLEFSDVNFLNKLTSLFNSLNYNSITLQDIEKLQQKNLNFSISNLNLKENSNILKEMIWINKHSQLSHLLNFSLNSQTNLSRIIGDRDSLVKSWHGADAYNLNTLYNNLSTAEDLNKLNYKNFSIFNSNLDNYTLNFYPFLNNSLNIINFNSSSLSWYVGRFNLFRSTMNKDFNFNSVNNSSNLNFYKNLNFTLINSTSEYNKMFNNSNVFIYSNKFNTLNLPNYNYSNLLEITSKEDLKFYLKFYSSSSYSKTLFFYSGYDFTDL